MIQRIVIQSDISTVDLIMERMEGVNDSHKDRLIKGDYLKVAGIWGLGKEVIIKDLSRFYTFIRDGKNIFPPAGKKTITMYFTLNNQDMQYEISINDSMIQETCNKDYKEIVKTWLRDNFIMITGEGFDYKRFISKGSRFENLINNLEKERVDLNDLSIDMRKFLEISYHLLTETDPNQVILVDSFIDSLCYSFGNLLFQMLLVHDNKQLIFTSNNPLYMKESLMRIDEMWIMEWEKFYSIADFKPTYDTKFDIYEHFIVGKFGGTYSIDASFLCEDYDKST